MTVVAPDLAAMTLDTVRRQSDNTVDAVVAGAAIFRSVDPAAVAVLTTHCRPVRFSPRQQVYGEGEPGDRLYIITSGKVKLGRRSPDGRSHLLAVVGPAEMFGELSLFDPGPRTSSAVALTEVDAVAMDRDALRRWIADHPEIAERMLQMMARRLRRTDHDLTNLVFSDVAGRVAKQLLRLAQQFGVQENGAMRVTHDLTQREIAQLIGATRESVNKVLTDFTQRGWIRLEGKSVLIAESECLVRRAS